MMRVWGTLMKKLAFAVLILASACGEDAADHDDDHSVDRLVVEGDGITDLFGPDGISDPIRTTEGFRRLGVLWDATEENVLELRTSLDGTTWTDWRTPEMVSVEMIAHAGHVDAITVAADLGSDDTDPLARQLQLRVPAGRVAPTFITVEPLADIPARVPDDTDFAAIDAAEEVGEIQSSAGPRRSARSRSTRAPTGVRSRRAATRGRPRRTARPSTTRSRRPTTR